jgi:hypothetical protein
VLLQQLPTLLVWGSFCLQVYESCEALFAGLADEAKKYSDWLVLGDVAGELEEHVEAALCGDGSSSSGAAGGDVGDWELNLRMLKTAAHDLNKLPNEVRSQVACCADDSTAFTFQKHMLVDSQPCAPGVSSTVHAAWHTNLAY